MRLCPTQLSMHCISSSTGSFSMSYEEGRVTTMAPTEPPDDLPDQPKEQGSLTSTNKAGNSQGGDAWYFFTKALCGFAGGGIIFTAWYIFLVFIPFLSTPSDVLNGRGPDPSKMNGQMVGSERTLMFAAWISLGAFLAVSLIGYRKKNGAMHLRYGCLLESIFSLVCSAVLGSLIALRYPFAVDGVIFAGLFLMFMGFFFGGLIWMIIMMAIR